MKKTATAVLLALLLLPLAACGPKRAAAPPPSRPANLLELADQAYLQEHYSDAISFYQQYLQGNPTKQVDHARFRLGLLHAWEGNYADALAQLRAVDSAKLTPEKKTQVALLIPLLERASQDAADKRNLEKTLNDIMKKIGG